VSHVLIVGIGNLDGQEEIAARIAAREAIVAFGRAEIAGAFLAPAGFRAERDLYARSTSLPRIRYRRRSDLRTSTRSATGNSIATDAMARA
jgi:hypothetical protein